MFTRIVTHNDFDGLMSAAICSAVHGIDEIFFTGPNHISRTGLSVLPSDIVCDLPWPGECGLWFDHHEGNIAELRQRGVDPASLPGAFALEKSCARVVINHYRAEYVFPAFYRESVKAVDKIDSFDFKDVAEWRAETPARIINDSLKCRFHAPEEEEAYLQSLVPRLAGQSLAEIAAEEDVRRYYRDYIREEERMLDLIRKNSRFHPLDPSREFAVIDLTGLPKRPSVVRNLAQILFPRIRGVFLLQCLYDRGVKTTNFSVSGSLTLHNNGAPKDVGEILRILNIGDGHKGAGSGQVFCSTKEEMEKKKEEVVDKIYKIWMSQ